ncbi:MAG: TlpA family protein disulfide reductase [Candidatus Marinimicrobia bacterium]|nr:TlpA family protein disulfide reductase [Candidatus Neomarinimicrobiota bacterium]
MIRINILIMFAMSFLTLVSCSSNENKSKIQAEVISLDSPDLKDMPHFELSYLDGSHFDSKSLEGKVVFVDFWATWCGPCLFEIPSMVEMGHKYKDDGFEIVGIAVQSGSQEDIQPTIDKLKMDYHVLIGDDEVMDAFGGIYGFPTNFLITRKGKIYKTFLGVYPEKDKVVEKDVRYLLGLDAESTELIG